MPQKLIDNLNTEGSDQAEQYCLPEPDENGIIYLTRQEGERLLDRQARKYLGMSGAEFRQQYRAGTLDPERSAVIRVSLLLPLAER
jgi:hypothetical protein